MLPTELLEHIVGYLHDDFVEERAPKQHKWTSKSSPPAKTAETPIVLKTLQSLRMCNLLLYSIVTPIIFSKITVSTLGADAERRLSMLKASPKLASIVRSYDFSPATVKHGLEGDGVDSRRLDRLLVELSLEAQARSFQALGNRVPPDFRPYLSNTRTEIGLQLGRVPYLGALDGFTNLTQLRLAFPPSSQFATRQESITIQKLCYLLGKYFMRCRHRLDTVSLENITLEDLDILSSIIPRNVLTTGQAEIAAPYFGTIKTLRLFLTMRSEPSLYFPSALRPPDADPDDISDIGAGVPAYGLEILLAAVRNLEDLDMRFYRGTDPQGFSNPHPAMFQWLYEFKRKAGGPSLSKLKSVRLWNLGMDAHALRYLTNSEDPAHNEPNELNEANTVRKLDPGTVLLSSDNWADVIRVWDERLISLEQLDVPFDRLRSTSGSAKRFFNVVQDRQSLLQDHNRIMVDHWLKKIQERESEA